MLRGLWELPLLIFSCRPLKRMKMILSLICKTNIYAFSPPPDHPMNISISQNPQLVVRGASVNLTCTSDANPAADIYTWYKRTDSTGSMLQVGSGQVLSVPSADASASGLYLCQAANHVGESNSTEVLLAMTEEEHGLWLFFQKIPYEELIPQYFIFKVSVTVVFDLLRQPDAHSCGWNWSCSGCGTCVSSTFVLVSQRTLETVRVVFTSFEHLPLELHLLLYF